MRLGVLGAGAIACDMVASSPRPVVVSSHSSFGALYLPRRMARRAWACSSTSGAWRFWPAVSKLTSLLGRIVGHPRMVARGQPVLGGDGPRSRERQRPFADLALDKLSPTALIALCEE